MRGLVGGSPARLVARIERALARFAKAVEPHLDRNLDQALAALAL